MRIQVAQGTQVHHDGITYGEGETLDVPDDVAAPWLASRWVTAATESKPVKASRRTRQ